MSRLVSDSHHTLSSTTPPREPMCRLSAPIKQPSHTQLAIRMTVKQKLSSCIDEAEHTLLRLSLRHLSHNPRVSHVVCDMTV